MDDFDTPDIPDPPPLEASPPTIDPEEVARRRAKVLRDRVTRDTLVINQGSAGRGGTGLRIDQ